MASNIIPQINIVNPNTGLIKRIPLRGDISAMIQLADGTIARRIPQHQRIQYEAELELLVARNSPPSPSLGL